MPAVSRSIARQKLKHSWQDFLVSWALLPHAVEWGTPHGGLGRLAAVSVLRKFQCPFTWILDRSDVQINPFAWQSLGVPLQNGQFIYEPQPLKTFKTLLLECSSSVVVFDSRVTLRSGDWSFIAQVARQRKIMPWVMRPFFLTAQNGNPFAKYRWNCFYQFESDQLRLSCVKGAPLGQSFYASLHEVFDG